MIRFFHVQQPASIKGFTLIELIVVVGIVAILSSFLIAILNPVEQLHKANDGRRKSDLAQIQRALEQYYQDNGSYPNNATSCTYGIRGTNVYGPTDDCIEWGQDWQPYMNVVPKEPLTGRTYVYYVGSNQQSYWLYASLERGSSDPQACNGGNECASIASNGITANACGATCNYGVSSPNTTP